MGQLVRVARIQLVNAFAVLALPVLILLMVLLFNIGIAYLVTDLGGDDQMSTGALAALYITMLISHIQTMTQMFPFAVGLSVTRRAFFGATALVVVGQALAYGILLTLLKYVESATNGWGFDLTFFALPFLSQDNAVLQTLVYAAPLMLLSFFGVWLGIVFKRWGQYGVWALGIGLSAILVGLLFLIHSQNWWGAVGRFFTEHSALALLAGYPALLALLFAGAGYLTTRRAVP
ncbi:hypothetical protein FFT09_07855 [Saccharomonospora piscinae]|uniref:hypothetical protein n=1 Tax=Saccharomonospora piscinae TaxID=687388 RepID=UPI001106D38F|nr:hypothetical protein [Saccharomonospora piscinae]TLW93316.1 hypothetical protein FFT09_07855 [Saccharomonospora piscinae]